MSNNTNIVVVNPEQSLLSAESEKYQLSAELKRVALVDMYDGIATASPVLAQWLANIVQDIFKILGEAGKQYAEAKRDEHQR